MKPNIDKQKLFFEFISVVFAVLLALLLNSWREHLATSRSLNKVKQTIKKEMLDNTEEVNKAYAYRLKLIRSLQSGRHLIMALPAVDIPVDVTNDQVFEEFLQATLPFGQSTPIDRLEILSSGDQRILMLNDRTYQVAVENDTLKLFGVGNIQLRTAEVSNRSWEIAQATGTLVEMELALVDALNKCHNLHNRYFETADKAIDLLYSGETGIIQVLEDMANCERDIITSDSVVLAMLHEVSIN